MYIEKRRRPGTQDSGLDGRLIGAREYEKQSKLSPGWS